MLKFIYILFIFVGLSFAPTSMAEVESTAKVGELLKLLIPAKGKKVVKGFDNSKCKTEELKWLLFLAMKQSFTQSYKFAPQCQIEGSFAPKSNAFFPMNLKLKNFYDYKKIGMKVQIELDSNTMVLTLTVKEALLSGSKNVLFSGSYRGKIAFEGSGVAFKSLGGKVLISKIDDKKVSISQVIK